MSTEDLVTIADFPNEQEAHMAQVAIEAQGIACYLVGSQASGTLWIVGTALGGVKLQVASRDVPQAVAILQDMEELETCGEWTCPRCGEEVDAGYDLCWSCGASVDQAANTSPHIPSDQLQKGSASEDAAEESVDEWEDEEQQSPPESADELASRAFKAAMIGISFLPALLYSLSLLFQLAGADLSKSGLKKYYWSTLIVLMMFTLYTFVALFFMRIAP